MKQVHQIIRKLEKQTSFNPEHLSFYFMKLPCSRNYYTMDRKLQKKNEKHRYLLAILRHVLSSMKPATLSALTKGTTLASDYQALTPELRNSTFNRNSFNILNLEEKKLRMTQLRSPKKPANYMLISGTYCPKSGVKQDKAPRMWYFNFLLFHGYLLAQRPSLWLLGALWKPQDKPWNSDSNF